MTIKVGDASITGALMPNSESLAAVDVARRAKEHDFNTGPVLCTVDSRSEATRLAMAGVMENWFREAFLFLDNGASIADGSLLADEAKEIVRILNGQSQPEFWNETSIH